MGRAVVRLSDCSVDHETRNALLVYISELEEQVWVPKSVIHDDSEVYKADTDGELVVLEWWAAKRGLL